MSLQISISFPCFRPTFTHYPCITKSQLTSGGWDQRRVHGYVIRQWPNLLQRHLLDACRLGLRLRGDGIVSDNLRNTQGSIRISPWINTQSNSPACPRSSCEWRPRDQCVPVPGRPGFFHRARCRHRASCPSDPPSCSDRRGRRDGPGSQLGCTSARRPK